MKKLLVMLVLLSMAFAAPVTVKGSDTLLDSVEEIAKGYKAEGINVSGGGSGAGITALLKGSTEIANASRQIKDKEIAKGKESGLEIKEIILAIDALSMIVNPSNKVKSLSVEQITKIYTGEYKNWSDVGGANQPIVLYGRFSNSGTYAFVKEDIIKGNYADTMISMVDNSAIVEAVKKDPGAIGYVGASAVIVDGKVIPGITKLSVSEKTGGTAYSATDVAAVNAGKYPLSRFLYQYISNKATPEGKAFIKYELSSAGQSLFKKHGFFLIGKDIMNKNEGLLK